MNFPTSLFSNQTARRLLAALVLAVLGTSGNARADVNFVTTYVTEYNTWGIQSSYIDTLLVSYNVYQRSTGALVESNAAIFVKAQSTADTGLPVATYFVQVTDARAHVPFINSTLDIVAEIGRPFSYQITASESPFAFDATGLPEGLGIDPNSGTISGTPTQIGTFMVGLTARGNGGTGPATLKLTIIDPFAFFDGSIYIPDNTYYLPFPGGTYFGLYTDEFYPYLYHYDLGFLYVFDAQDAPHGVYLYDFATQTFWYTNPGLFPYMYDFTLKTFIYYFPDNNRKGHYTTGPRYFYNFSTRKTFTK